MITIVDVCLLNCCTYSCTGCISNSSPASAINHEMPDGTIRAIYQNNGVTLKPVILVNFIRNHFLPSECFVQLSGGEPTLHDAFIPLVHSLLSMGYKLVVNTNGNQLKSLSKQVEIEQWPIKWRCSWHNQFRCIEKFMEDIEPLEKENVLINYVAKPWQIETKEIEKDMESLDKTGYLYEVTGWQGKWSDKDYDKNSLIYRPYLTAFKDYAKTPAVETNYIAIQANGNIARCHKVGIGNIYKNQLRERYPQGKQVCAYAENGNTNCGLVQSLYLLGYLS